MSHPLNKHERLQKGHHKALPAFETYYSEFGTKEDMPGHFGVLRKTRKHCSDPRCCGNSRRERHVKNLTLQEIRQLDREKDFIIEE